MTRELSDKKNLLEAMAVKKSGFPTKIHASPHKEEIDKWIAERNWSGRKIANELKRLYPNENHPSDRAIDNYKKRYFPMEAARNLKGVFSEEIRKKIAEQFDPVLEGLELWGTVKDAIDKVREIMEKTSVPPKIMVDLFKVGNDSYKILCDEWARFGFIKTVPQSFEITEKTIVNNGKNDIKSRLERIIVLKKEIEEIEKKIGEGGVSFTEQLGNDNEKRDVVEGHSVNDGAGIGVQEPVPSGGVVSDLGQQEIQKNSDSSPEKPRQEHGPVSEPSASGNS